MTSDYKKPQYIKDAAKKKYGKDIFVLGSTQDEINKFMKKIQHQALSASPPEEVGRFVINIDCKSHTNHADGQDNGRDKPDDWYDEFEITSKRGASETRSTSYQLQLTSSKETQVGANLSFDVSGTGFFNLAGGSGGLSGASGNG